MGRHLKVWQAPLYEQDHSMISELAVHQTPLHGAATSRMGRLTTSSPGSTCLRHHSMQQAPLHGRAHNM